MEAGEVEAAINSPSVAQVFDIRSYWNISISLEQELSGSVKATLGNIINHNMQLAQGATFTSPSHFPNHPPCQVRHNPAGGEEGGLDPKDKGDKSIKLL